MNKLYMALALAAALACARTASAVTYESYKIQGNSCVSTTPGNTGIYTQWGPYNASSTTPLNVTCPLVLPNVSYTYAFISVEGWSRNASDLLSCTIYTAGWDGYNGMSITAAVSYQPGAAGNMARDMSPSPTGQGALYLNCHIPVFNSAGASYLTNMVLNVGH